MKLNSEGKPESYFVRNAVYAVVLTSLIIIPAAIVHARDVTNADLKHNSLKQGKPAILKAPVSQKVAANEELADTYSPKLIIAAAPAVSNAPVIHAANSPVPLNPMIPPTNLTVNGKWENGKSFDTLNWSAVPGAVSYTVFATSTYKPIAEGVKTNSVTIPVDTWRTGMYYVMSIDAHGQESIPSAPAAAQGGFDPNKPDHDKNITVSKHVPQNVQAVPEWNHGAPRIRVSWEFKSDHCPFSVYRDGTEAAHGLWVTYWFDNQVKVGEHHTYTVSAVRHAWPGKELETPQSASASGTAPTHPVSFNSDSPVKIINIIPNDDSAKITFEEVPGAVDYRVFRKNAPGYMKYSGGAQTIEMNDLDTEKGEDLVVEAVDKLGPFQTMDGVYCPGTIQRNGDLIAGINGQGDPSNEPIVIARSAPFHVTPEPRKLTGKEAFFDTFRNESQLTPTPAGNIDSDLAAMHLKHNPPIFAEFQNDKWILRMYDADTLKSKFFFMGSHFMDTLYDFSKTMRGKTIMIPKKYPKVPDGQYLHITFEVDAHSDPRRYNGVMITPAADTLLLDSGGGPPTKAGNALDWEIFPSWHQVSCFKNREHFALGRTAEPGDSPSKQRKPTAFRWQQVNGGYTGGLNGNMDTLDYRHRFDLYLSSKRYVAMEEGRVMKDVDLTRAIGGEAKTASDQTLEWLSKGPVAVNFYHYIYHSAADRTEIMNGFIAPYPAYWINYRPYSDERHWDNMGFEVVDSLPNLPTAAAEEIQQVNPPVQTAKAVRQNTPKPKQAARSGIITRADGFVKQEYIKVPVIRP